MSKNKIDAAVTAFGFRRTAGVFEVETE